MNELRQRRKELGLTQIEAAKACGVSRRTYQTYEENTILNDTYKELIKKIDELGVFDGCNYVLNLKYIKHICKQLFKEKYPEIRSAYLFGSYARGEANGKSDVDILVVCPPMGMKFYGIVAELEESLHKTIDLHTHRQLVNNEKFLEEILNEGIKIYG
jgi:predicted nucleotidyltransferase/DNA-binding XRE family transcriptional regulator